MEHLLNLGHKKILFLHGREGNVNFDLRYQTYCSILKKNSLEPLVLKTGGEDSETAYRKVKTFLPLHKEITAIFGGNDGNALGALRAVKELGLNVPKDISLIGFDDIPEAGKSEPPLTTLHIPIEEMGRLGVETLLKRIENQNKDLPVKIFLPTRLIIRQSTVSDADEKITKKVAQEKRVAEIKRITDPHLK